MIVDMHTHFIDFEREVGKQARADLTRSGIPHGLWTYSEEEYLAGTGAADKVVAFGLDAQRTGWNARNDRVADFVARHNEKYIYFASIDPSRDGFMQDLAYNHLELKCRGVKIGPIYQGVHPCDQRYYDIYSYCERNALPIITHMATTFSSGVPLDYARPYHMDQVACDFPGLRLVLAHLGHPWEAEAIAIIRRNSNVYADISALYYRPWQFYNAMRLAEEYGCCHKLLFGSDFPATTTEGSIKGLRGVNDILGSSGLPPIPADTIEAIITRDSLAILFNRV
ncbi:MAG: amidohydrolase family protein [Oscillospiraceae bacterium]|nr:amidohydrolase family protein [Oscillospiraceae bacterium]